MVRHRKLKVWNGLVLSRVKGKTTQLHANVCAYSQKEAVEILNSYSQYSQSLYYFRLMWSDCWGNSMNDIVPERGLWVEFPGMKPERVI